MNNNLTNGKSKIWEIIDWYSQKKIGVYMNIFFIKMKINFIKQIIVSHYP
jgi:hypothetical protein